MSESDKKKRAGLKAGFFPRKGPIGFVAVEKVCLSPF